MKQVNRQACAKSKAEKEVFTEVSEINSKVFEITKQMDRTNQDLMGKKWIKNISELLLSVDKKFKA